MTHSNDKPARNHAALWLVALVLGAVFTLVAALIIEDMPVQERLSWQRDLGTPYEIIYAPIAAVFLFGSGALLYLTSWFRKKAPVISEAAAATGGSLPATVAPKPINKSLWLALVYGSLLLGAIFTGWAASDPAVTELIALGLPLVAVGGIANLVFWFKAWGALQDGMARTSPGKAIGLLLVPVFNIYWLFQVIPGWAQDHNAMVERAGIDLPRVNAGVYTAYAVCSILPFVSAIAVLVLLPIVLGSTCDAINRLHAARTGE